MSRFYGTVQAGNKSIASRCGHKSTGLSSHTRGWDQGVKVTCDVEGEDKDVISVWLTGGSKNPGRLQLIACIEDGKVLDKP